MAILPPLVLHSAGNFPAKKGRHYDGMILSMGSASRKGRAVFPPFFHSLYSKANHRWRHV